MRIRMNPSALKNVSWPQYAVRFFFGGLVTACTGLIANHYGPSFGGLFLAFPAIFPASATLVERQQEKKKRRAGLPDGTRGRDSAAIDARGAAMGATGLALFGLLTWRLLPNHNSVAVLALALLGWFALSFTLWTFRRVPRSVIGGKPH